MRKVYAVGRKVHISFGAFAFKVNEHVKTPETLLFGLCTLLLREAEWK